MADNSNTPTPEISATDSTIPAIPEAIPPSSPAPPAIALWLEVANAATTKGSAVRELVISELTQQEIIKRTAAVIALLDKYEVKTKELKKAEAVCTWDLNVNGDKVGDPKYTKEQVGIIKGLRDEIAKISQALTNFFEKNDTNKLYELAKK